MGKGKVVIKEAIIEGKKDNEPVVIEQAKVEGVAEELPQQSMKPTTTAQQDLTYEGQRKINLIWEITQAIIAIIVTLAVIYSVLAEKQSDLLGNAFTLIIAIYFVRMNHIKIGGVGERPVGDAGR